MSDFDKVKYNNAYNKKNYKEIRFLIPKEDEQIMITLATQNGYKTIGAYAKALLKAASEEEKNN